MIVQTGGSPSPSTSSRLRRKKGSSRLGHGLKQNDGSIAVTGKASSFFLMITGQIELAQTKSWMSSQLYCRYTISYGQDWAVAHGMTEGTTQIACSRREEGKSINVFNFPLEVSFQSTNTHNWPRLCLSVYGIDFLGRDVLRGHASVLLPINPGRHTKLVPTYRPVSGNVFQQFASTLTGTQPEYHDTKITARGEGRSLTRVVSEKNLTLKINLVTTRKDFQSFGYVSK